MKRISLFLLLFFPVLVWGQSQTSYEQLFWKQIAGSCSTGATWTKTVSNITQKSKAAPQSKVFTVDCNTGRLIPSAEDSAIHPGVSEFDFLFEYDANSPFIKDYFSILEDKKGFDASLKVDNQGDSPLQAQKFTLSENGLLSYAMSHIKKDNMLYNMEVKVEVWFDATGRYDHHTIETMTEPILDDGIHTIVRGELKP